VRGQTDTQTDTRTDDGINSVFRAGNNNHDATLRLVNRPIKTLLQKLLA